MSLPKNLSWAAAQTVWAQDINPVLKNQLIQGVLITDIKLINGVTVINHMLSRQMVGWFLTDIDASATVYRSQPLNTKTLTLTSNSVATVNVWCF